MEYDKIEKINNSTIQHGKNNNRIYLMKLDKKDYPEIIKKLNSIAKKNEYTKIFVKIPNWAIDEFKKEGYNQEGHIPNFYNNKTDAYFYKQVFESYPFPIFNPEFIKTTMNDNVVYFGIYDKHNLIAAASSEMDVKSQNAEMTDFATLPDYRGHNLSLTLLREMEAEMRQRKIKTLYTIARSHSPGMNITFAKLNYSYSGTLINNTDIFGKIESMNIWYKNLTN
ncbi:MAG: putative beta-lysine N-acetyltransferase [Calditrichaceae bacterium]